MATFNVSQKRVNKHGEAPVYISFYINREKIEVPTRLLSFTERTLNT